MRYGFSEIFLDVTKFGKKIPSQQYANEGTYPIIDQGKEDIAGYTDEDNGLFTDVPAIIFGDHTRILKYVDKPCFLGADGVKLLKSIHHENNDKYLFYALKNVKIPDTGYNRHFKWLKQACIPVPQREEQDYIVRVLDTVERLITCRKEELEKLDDLVKSRFFEMFGECSHSKYYPYQKIKDFAEVRSGGTPSRKYAEYWENGTIRWVKTTELKNCIISDTEEKITEEGMIHSSAKLMPANTVLVAMYGQGKTRGMTAYLGSECTTNQACACILPSDKINPKYLWRFLILSYESLRNLAQGAGQPNLTGEMIKNFPILMPTRNLQDEYVDFCEAIDKSKLAVQKSLEELETLKKSLMQQYFG